MKELAERLTKENEMIDYQELPDWMKKLIPEVELDPSIPRGIVEEREEGKPPKRTDLQEFLDRFRR